MFELALFLLFFYSRTIIVIDIRQLILDFVFVNLFLFIKNLIIFAIDCFEFLIL